MNRHYLEQLPHLLFVAETVDSFFQLGNALGIGRCKRGRPGADPQAVQPIALGHDCGNLRSRLACRTSERLEVHVGRKVLFAGIDQGRHITVTTHRLESVARRASLMAIVDHQGHTATLHETGGDGGNSLLPRWRLFDDLAVAVECEPVADNFHAALDPAHKLVDWECVEKLVSDEQQWCRGKVFDSVMPVSVGHPLCLQGTENGTGFHEAGATRKTGAAKDTQRICGEAPPARPKL